MAPIAINGGASFEHCLLIDWSWCRSRNQLCHFSPIDIAHATNRQPVRLSAPP
jgi:hypothetical protein